MTDELHPQVLATRRTVSDLARQRDSLFVAAGRSGILDIQRLNQLDETIARQLDLITDLVDPCDASPSEPLVLLPVRLETRLADTERGIVLKVRIYPDEIHVDDLVRGLTEAEVAAGRAYWSAVWAEPIDEAAFGQLVEAVSSRRAEWVAHVCTPTNLAERPAVAPVFSDVGLIAARNVVARSLPDRFVVTVTQGGTTYRGVGAPVPRDLMLSPIALEGDDVVRTAEQLAVPVGAEWLVDFDEAVKVGMGVVVPLPSRAPISQVMALGTRASASPVDGAAELEALFEGHRYGGGLALLAQDTPTNNSDGERSPYRSRPAPAAPALTPPAADPASDAAAAAAVLGVDPTTMTALLGHGSGEQLVSKQVNTALWAPGWGAYLLSLDEHGVPGIDDAQRESGRQLFRDHVRGRGPSPALRVRAQPYGVLPVSDLRRWEPAAGETTGGIVRVVRMLLDRWLAAANQRVRRIRPGQSGIDESLLEVLGASPVAQGLRVRPVVTDDVSSTLIGTLGLDHHAYDSEKALSAAVFSYLLPDHSDAMMISSLHRQDRPLPLPMASDRDPEFLAALLGTPSRILAVDSVLQALAVLALDISDEDVVKSAPATVVPELIQSAALSPELRAKSTALFERADSASAEEFHAVAAEITATGIVAGGPSALAQFQPVAHISTSLAEVALAAPAGDARVELTSAALAGWMLQMGYSGEVRRALASLSDTTTAVRVLAVAEALDCSSHRLDAWATAIVSERRALQGTRRGLTIGAYGVVHDVQPTPPNSDGWIHAPSTQHAVAAGLLRSSHLSHLPEGSGGGAFAIDLSSRRMRRATALIDGVRQGQQLAALVGYQIERDLSVAGLARLQLSLRAIAPLIARRLHAVEGGDDDGVDDDRAREAVAATDVVDGLLLLRRHPPGDIKLRKLLNQRPVNAYLDPEDWVALTDKEWLTVTQALTAAAEAVDAVADVMLSESVLQYANGNHARAAAAMDVMGVGASPPDILDILETHESGERLTHRVVVAVGTGQPSAWNASAPRAVAEPALEKWASAHLGSPASIVVADRSNAGGGLITLDAAGFAALDVIYATDLVAFERSIRLRIQGLADVELSTTQQPGWPVGMRALGRVLGLASTLRAIMAGATPLTAPDLARPGESSQRPGEPSRADLEARMTQAAASLTATVAALEAQVAAIPADGMVPDDATAATLAAAADVLSGYGVPLTPTETRPLDMGWVRSAWEVARARSLSATDLVGGLAVLPTGTPMNLVLDAAQNVADTVFGDGFIVVPALTAALGGDAFADAMSQPAFAQPGKVAVRRLVRDFATVREQVRRFSELLLVGGALGASRHLEVVQIGERTKDGPAAGTDRWLAGPLPESGPWPVGPVAHLLVDAVGLLDPSAPIAGLVVDAWVEDLPTQVGPNADPDDPQPGASVTGLAIRANAASARAPQAILSAISPDGARWTTDSLRAVVNQTLDLARVRLVRLDQLLGEGLALPALYVRSSSLRGEPAWQFSDLKLASFAHVTLPYVKEVP
ncbi:MAG: hypothetical protein QM619_05705 [Micropruina sp.]|uniref:hypothetical protein n=1 Tax=Micropruina sp. TaxID=2737536 RepID=UPI0039E64F28